MFSDDSINRRLHLQCAAADADTPEAANAREYHTSRARDAATRERTVPANRSRTERYRELLQQIMERGGGIEFSLARPVSATADQLGPDLVWRVRLLAIRENELVVEQPTAMGRVMPLQAGAELVGAIVVGQNRWMFHTRTIGVEQIGAGRSPVYALRLAMPEGVERCSRRDFLRISTAELKLPSVECWPLLDPTSVGGAETANRAMILEAERTGTFAIDEVSPTQDSMLLPMVGPSFSAALINIGGGGVGLIVGRENQAAAMSHRLIWMRISLFPQIPGPIGVTARIVHTHLDSQQNTYLGVAFDFAFNPSHREFVVDQITRYLTRMQGVCKAA